MFISKRSNGFYFVEFLDPATNKIRRITTKTKIKREAIKFLKNFEKEVFLKSEVQEKSLSEFAIEYSEFIRNTFSKKYLSSVQLSFRKIIEYMGNKKMNDITIKDTQNFLTKTHQRTKRGAELYLRTLKAAFNRAQEWEYINTNPFLKIRLPKTYKSYPIFITRKEFESILILTEEQLFQDIFTIAFYTGMRLGEIVNMKWKWINFKQDFITVLNDHSFMNKGKKDRIIPMVKMVRKILSRLSTISNKNISSDEYIFNKVLGVRLNEDYVSKKFKQVIRKSNLSDKIHFHTLRHSFASNLVQQGVDLYVVKELLGHEDVRTTQIYSHLQSDNLFKAIQLLD